MVKRVDKLIVMDSDEVTMFDISHLSILQQTFIVEWIEKEVKRLSRPVINLEKGNDYGEDKDKKERQCT